VAKFVQPPDMVDRLAELFHCNGYVRYQNPDRLSAEGYLGYKKGDEVRLIAGTQGELREIRRLLRGCGFRVGRAFRKGKKWCQPIYGRPAVARFLDMMESHNTDTPQPIRSKQKRDT
jgi:hypothetical protein